MPHTAAFTDRAHQLGDKSILGSVLLHRRSWRLAVLFLCVAGLSGCASAPEWLSFLQIKPTIQVAANPTLVAPDASMDELGAQVAAITPAAGAGHSATRAGIEDEPRRHDDTKRPDLTQNSFAPVFFSVFLP